jgi:hypothetical protein
MLLEQIPSGLWFMHNIRKLSELSANHQEVTGSQEVLNAAKEGLVENLSLSFFYGNGYEYGLEIKRMFLNNSPEILNSQEVQKAARNACKEFLREAYINYSIIDKAIKFREEFLVDVNDPKIKKEALLVLSLSLRRIELEHAKEIIDQFLNYCPEDVSKNLIREMESKLNNNFDVDGAIKITVFFLSYYPEILKSDKVRECAQKYLTSLLNKNDLESARKFYNDFLTQYPQTLVEVLKPKIIYSFSRGYFDEILEIENYFPEIKKIVQESIITFIKNEDIYEITKIIENINIFEEVIDSPEVQKFVEASNIFGNVDVGSLDRGCRQIGNLTEEELGVMFGFVQQEFLDWQDEQTISGPFQAGAETFGYKRMLEYIKRKDLSLHDAVHAFRDVLELYRASGLGESEFYGQVLQQVRMDDREYPEGTAHHHLNAIAQTANKNVAEVISRVQEYREIEKLQELAASFNTLQAVFASWVNLKRYSELEQLLGQSEVFDELKELKEEGKEKLYRYIETLAFHPDSKVNMSAVMQFWRDPESFLAADASHTPHEVHDRKKPSNYLYMPNLDLTASELRDALVEGKMDGLSAFTPLEIRYTIPLENIESETLPDLVKKALGSSKEGVKGVAKNSRKLFSELGKLLKPHRISVVEYIQGKSLPEGVNLSQEIEDLLYNRDFGMERPLVKTREFVARISQKSDPEGAIAGDDTVNCMPFGDGKNTVYTFNPNTAQFVIRVVKGDGKERTIAQSVLTKDMDIKTLVPNVISELQQEGGHLGDILPADILATAPVYAACDNVEVAPNYSDKRHQQIIEVIFRDFFREYMSRYSKTEGLNPKKVPIGQGFTDALSQLPTETNTFAPQAPVSYSDKTGDSVYMLDLGSNARMDLIWQRQVRETELKRKTESPLPKIKGLGYLTFEDTLKVAYIEGKAYSDNQSLMQFLFDMENGLIAKDINNVAKDRPNMSIRYTDEDGRMHGYMLAWEGRLLDENVEYNAGEFFNQPCVYIIDIATDRENRMAGGRLIQGFAELYKQNYLDKGNLMPIFAQAREATSYQILKRQLDKLGKDIGFNFELVELPTYEVGEDIMHPIIIRPLSKKK